MKFFPLAICTSIVLSTPAWSQGTLPLASEAADASRIQLEHHSYAPDQLVVRFDSPRAAQT